MELKFRCWNGEEMVCPDHVDRNGVAWWKENSIPTSSKDVMLWTGRYDKDGKKIWLSVLNVEAIISTHANPELPERK